ncbi:MULTISPECIES: 3-phosphoshikimate 1-carboxyvinyltransferase [Rahnella]|uniref:3-phosphoshikimate 1-carboxyvinyltransferase n=1 Tax=Rahnella TaxID=34037 RepID=UPI003B9ED94A
MSDSVLVNGFKRQHDDVDVLLPGSKSISLRCLLIAALADGESTLREVAKCDDIDEMTTALRALGCDIESVEDTYYIKGNGGHFRKGEASLILGLSGTSARFLIATAMLRSDLTIIDGLPPLRVRPNRELISAIQRLGAEVNPKDAIGLPVQIIGAPDTPIVEISMNGNFSSQYFSALMIIAPLLKNGLYIKVIGDLVSRPYIAITIDQMGKFGVDVKSQSDSAFHVGYKPYIPTDMTVEGDASAASYFSAIALLHGIKITLRNLGNSTKQGDYKFLDVCERLGADIDRQTNFTVISGPKSGMRSIGEPIDMESMPDVAPTLMAIAPFVPGGLHLTGLSTLRIKECDRLGIPAGYLKRLGVDIVEGSDYIKVGEWLCNPETPVSLETHHDHRIAMSFAILASKVGNIKILDKSCVRKTYPNFWREMRRIGVKISE